MAFCPLDYFNDFTILPSSMFESSEKVSILKDIIQMPYLLYLGGICWHICIDFDINFDIDFASYLHNYHIIGFTPDSNTCMFYVVLWD